MDPFQIPTAPERYMALAFRHQPHTLAEDNIIEGWFLELNIVVCDKEKNQKQFGHLKYICRYLRKNWIDIKSYPLFPEKF